MIDRKDKKSNLLYVCTFLAHFTILKRKAACHQQKKNVPRRAMIIPVIISGVQAPIAKIVRPITDSGMPNVSPARERG